MRIYMSTMKIRTAKEENTTNIKRINMKKEGQKMFEMNINDMVAVNGGIHVTKDFRRIMKKLSDESKQTAQEEQKKENSNSVC